MTVLYRTRPRFAAGLTSRQRGRTARRPRLVLAPLALAVACLLGAGPAGAAGAGALPTGWQVVQGQASVLTQGNRMTVTNSANALLNWQQFSIGAGNSVRFEQPGAASKVLNRVVGNDPSAIFGSLSSNGQVWLLNPNGVLFGATARVDVAGLVASTLNIGNADWQAGRFSLAAGAAAAGQADAGVLNQGELRTLSGGRVLLIGTAGVRNDGLIDAPDGQVLLAAGRSVDLVDSGLPHLAVRLTAPAGEVLNLGQVMAAGGRIDLQAALVNQQGLVRADGLGTGPAGQVWLTGSDTVQAGAGSRTSARGAAGAGGSITLQGRQVALLDGSVVDASGASGGDLRIGGGAQGLDASLRNAQAVYMGPGATALADATGGLTGQGNGGRIVLWGDKVTRAYGTLSARGGPLGGDGGFIETSGGWLDAQPVSLRTDSPAGRAGQWLLDPDDLIITSGAPNSQVSAGPNFIGTGGTAVLNTASIESALNGNTNVTVTTRHDGQGHGDIQVVNAEIKATPTRAVSLTLNADRDISIDRSTLRSDGAELTLNLSAGRGEVASRGAVSIRSSSILTRGGDIVIGGALQTCVLNPCNPADNGALADDSAGLHDGIQVAGSTLDAAAGSITMRGFSVAETGDASGVAILDGATLTARQITLRGRVDSGGAFQRTGVKLGGGLVWATDQLDIKGSAYSGTYNAFASPTGVDVLSELRAGTVDGPASAQMTVTGLVNEVRRPAQGNLPVVRRFAVGVHGAAAKLVALGGASISVDGQDLSTNNDYSVYAVGTVPAFIDASAGGALSLTGNQELLLKGELRTPEGKAFSMQTTGALTIDGASLSGNASQVLLGAAFINIGLSGDSTRLVFGDATTVIARANDFRFGKADGFFVQNVPPVQGGVQPEGGPVRRALAAAGDAPALPGANALLATGGTVQIEAHTVLIGDSAALYSTATGDAIKVLGRGEPPSVGTFENRSGSGALGTPNGRWLVYAADSDNADLPFLPGGLRADFLQYNARPGTATAEAGKGFLFSVAPLVFVDLPISRTYDGTDRIDFSALEVALRGFKAGETVNGTWRAASKNVGANQALRLDTTGTGVTDANGAPVYGYQFDATTLVATIDRRNLAVSSFNAADKTYDGNTTASVSGLGLSGVLAGETVGASGVGRFDTRNAGANKAVSLVGVSLNGADAGNYLALPPDKTASASILAKAIDVNAGALGSKVYDGNTSAPLVDSLNLTVAGLVVGDKVSAAAGSAAFADKRVGVNKTLQLGGVTLAGGDAGNYRVASATASGDITARALTVVAATAADKVFDNTTSAASSGVTLAGVLDGDTVAARATGSFADKNVGADKAVTLTGYSLSGNAAANYALAAAPVLQTGAAITPAALRYTADLQSVTRGAALPALTGGVAGLVGGDTLAAATTGQLAFNTTATSTSEPGSYAVDGSGLVATNYVFSQAARNASALTITPTPVVAPPPLPELNTSRTSVVTLLPAPAITSASSGRALDALQVVLPGANGEKQAFANLDLDHMSQQSVASVLAARDQYKKTIFGQALSKLEQNPGLADAPGCASAEQAATGQCLMITPLNAGSAISNARVVERAGVAAPPVPAIQAPAAPAAGPTVAAAPAPAAELTPAAGPTPAAGLTPAAAPAARPVAAAPVEKARPLTTRLPVKSAALPQIQRKIAVLIGIDKYSDERIPKLGNAVADAEAVAESLRTNLGYETLVLQDATRADVFRTLNQLAAEVGPADSVVLYYAGHGELVEKTGQGYWQPSDADATRPETWIANADIGRLLRQLPASQLAMISDSCFSGSLVSGERIRGVAGSQDANALLSHRSVVVMSSGGNEPVFDSGKNGHSTFSFSLMQSLQQVSTWKAGSSVFEQVRFAVAKQLPQRPVYGASSAGGHEQGGDYLFEQRQLDGPKR